MPSSWNTAWSKRATRLSRDAPGDMAKFVNVRQSHHGHGHAVLLAGEVGATSRSHLVCRRHGLATRPSSPTDRRARGVPAARCSATPSRRRSHQVRGDRSSRSDRRSPVAPRDAKSRSGRCAVQPCRVAAHPDAGIFDYRRRLSAMRRDLARRRGGADRGQGTCPLEFEAELLRGTNLSSYRRPSTLRSNGDLGPPCAPTWRPGSAPAPLAPYLGTRRSRGQQAVRRFVERVIAAPSGALDKQHTLAGPLVVTVADESTRARLTAMSLVSRCVASA